MTADGHTGCCRDPACVPFDYTWGFIWTLGCSACGRLWISKRRSSSLVCSYYTNSKYALAQQWEAEVELNYVPVSPGVVYYLGLRCFETKDAAVKCFLNLATLKSCFSSSVRFSLLKLSIIHQTVVSQRRELENVLQTYLQTFFLEAVSSSKSVRWLQGKRSGGRLSHDRSELGESAGYIRTGAKINIRAMSTWGLIRTQLVARIAKHLNEQRWCLKATLCNCSLQNNSFKSFWWDTDW